MDLDPRGVIGPASGAQIRLWRGDRAEAPPSIGIGAESFATIGTLEDALRHAFDHAGIGRRSAGSA